MAEEQSLAPNVLDGRARRTKYFFHRIWANLRQAFAWQQQAKKAKL